MTISLHARYPSRAMLRLGRAKDAILVLLTVRCSSGSPEHLCRESLPAESVSELSCCSADAAIGRHGRRLGRCACGCCSRRRRLPQGQGRGGGTRQAAAPRRGRGACSSSGVGTAPTAARMAAYASTGGRGAQMRVLICYQRHTTKRISETNISCAARFSERSIFSVLVNRSRLQ